MPSEQENAASPGAGRDGRARASPAPPERGLLLAGAGARIGVAIAVAALLWLGYLWAVGPIAAR